MFRSLLAGAALAALLSQGGCDAPPDATIKEMAGPEGVEQANADAAAQADRVEPASHDDHAHEAPSGERLAAHEHGAGILAAALDGSQLTFTFEAPLASLVGFEHAPETDEQSTALAALKDAFVRPDAMVAVNAAAECLPQMTTSGTHMSGGHGALEVEHVYTCAKPGRITSIEFLMMEDYPALETIDAVFLSDARQSAGMLTASSPVLAVR